MALFEDSFVREIKLKHHKRILFYKLIINYNVTNRVANKNNFRAASHLLMSLTVYPYTRKTWKKEVFEMLFENLFFHVDAPTLEYSKSIIDNLISNDRTMFKDVLSIYKTYKIIILRLSIIIFHFL